VWADRREILHDAPKYVQFYNPGPKFWGSLPKKFLGVKNMQNLARFWSTSKFGGQFLWNGWRYSKSVSYSFDTDSSRVRRNKSGEVWSSNLGDLDVELNPLKAHFLEDHISAPRGCCAPKFLHALENHQVLLAHPHITQCQKHFADCAMVKFKSVNCDLCCFISTTTMSPLHCI